MSGKTAAGSAGHVCIRLILTLLLWLLLFCSTRVCCGGIIVVMVMISNLFKVSSGLLTQAGALVCKAQGRQLVRNAPVLMVVMEIGLGQSPPGVTVFCSWPVKISLNGN